MAIEVIPQRTQHFVGNLHTGMALPELRKRPTATMLFRFSAVTWNAHRIHYDQAYARSEGYPDVLVQATMHGAFLLQMLRGFAGLSGRVLQFTYSNRAPAVPGEGLICGGSVLAVDLATGGVDCEVWEKKDDGSICARGTARVRLPLHP